MNEFVCRSLLTYTSDWWKAFGLESSPVTVYVRSRRFCRATATTKLFSRKIPAMQVCNHMRISCVTVLRCPPARPSRCVSANFRSRCTPMSFFGNLFGSKSESREGKNDNVLKFARSSKPGTQLAPTSAPAGQEMATFAGVRWLSCRSCIAVHLTHPSIFYFSCVL